MFADSSSVRTYNSEYSLYINIYVHFFIATLNSATNLIASICGVGLVGVGEGEGGEGGWWTAVQGHVLQQEPALRVHVLNTIN